jgi:hypothetical protein
VSFIDLLMMSGRYQTMPPDLIEFGIADFTALDNFAARKFQVNLTGTLPSLTAASVRPWRNRRCE